MTSKRCPECGLVNPAIAMKCDCGFSFVTNEMTYDHGAHSEERAHRAARRSWVSSQIGWGAVLLVIGIVITAATYSSVSESGGTYLLAWGPMLVGAIKIVRGLAHLND